MTKTTMISITGPSKSNTAGDWLIYGTKSVECACPHVESGLQGTVPDLRTERSEVVESGLSPLLRNKKGITLMEILVVIVIIAVLAAALLPAVTTGLKKSYVRKAETTIATIQSALEMYKRDWGYYPESTGGVADGADQQNGNQGTLVSALTGLNLTTGNPDPKKGQPYMTLKKSDLDASGRCLLDPWGNAYIYIARKYGNASGSVKNANTAHGPFWPYTTPVSERTRNTYNIYSLGPDGKTNGPLSGNTTGNYAITYFNDPDDGNGGKTGSYLGDTNNDDDLNSWSGQ